jgi:hypothetical protein
MRRSVALLGDLPEGIRVHSLIVMTISDVETLTASQDAIDLIEAARAELFPLVEAP